MKMRLKKTGALLLSCAMMLGVMCPTAYAAPYWNGEEDGIVYQHVVLDSEKNPVDIGAVSGALDVSELEAGMMTARKFGAFANEEDAANGIVKLTLDVAGKPVAVEQPMDILIIADESGSLNMSGKSTSHILCLSEDHYYRIDGLKEELEKMSALKAAAGGKRVDFVIAEEDRESVIYVKPHEYGLAGKSVSSVYGTYKDTLYEMVTAAYSEKYGSYPDNLTKADVLVAISYDNIRYEKNGTLTKKYGASQTLLWDKHYALIDGEYVNISEALVDGTFEYNYDGFTGEVVQKAYDYWTPAYQFDYDITDGDYEYGSGHPYGCYDYMIVEKQQAISLAKRVLSANESNRVAYVGFAEHSFIYQSQDFTADANELAEHLNRTKGYSYTNYSSALRAAIELLEERQKDNSNTNKPCYVVFISDGAPNKEKDTVDEYADILKGLLTGGAVYSIGFKTDNAYLAEIADEGKYYSTSDLPDFAEAMNLVIENTSKVYPSGVLTDVIGDDFDLIVDADHPFTVDGEKYESADAAVDAGRVTIDGANLSWNLNDVDEEGVRISFYVQVDDLEKYEALLPTNADTDEATGANVIYHKLVVDDNTNSYYEETDPTNIALKTPYLLMTEDTSGSIQRILSFYKTAKVIENEKEILCPLKGIEFEIYYLCSVEEYNQKLQNGEITEDTAIEKLEREYVATVTTDEGGKALYNLTENQQPDGIYLIKELEHDAIEKPVDPFLVAVPGTEKETGEPVYVVDITPKNVPVKPDIKKDVMKPSYDMDETVTWIIQGDIPKDMAKAFSYVITDELDERLTYVGNVVVNVEEIAAEKVKPAQGNMVAGTDYTLTVAGNTIKIELTKDGRAKAATLAGENYADHELRVYFDTYIDADAAMGEAIPNDATLEYTNSANFEWVVLPENKPEVYTCGINVHKYDAKDNTKALSGAIFKLAEIVEKDTEGAVKLVIKDAAGQVQTVDVIYKEFYTDAACTIKANTVTTDAAGNALLYGLEAGTYYLVETKAPAGYNLLSYPVKVTLDQTSHHTGDIKATTEIVEIDRTVKVANSNTFVLPETGGIGTAIFTLAGSLMMGGAGVMLVNKKRKED